MFQKCSNFLETKLPILLFLPRHHFKQYRTLVGSKDFEKFWRKRENRRRTACRIFWPIINNKFVCSYLIICPLAKNCTKLPTKSEYWIVNFQVFSMLSLNHVFIFSNLIPAKNWKKFLEAILQTFCPCWSYSPILFAGHIQLRITSGPIQERSRILKYLSERF